MFLNITKYSRVKKALYGFTGISLMAYSSAKEISKTSDGIYPNLEVAYGVFAKNQLITQQKEPLFGLVKNGKYEVEIIRQGLAKGPSYQIHPSLLATSFIINGERELVESPDEKNLTVHYKAGRDVGSLIRHNQKAFPSRRLARNEEIPYIFDATVRAAHGWFITLGKERHSHSFQYLYDKAKTYILGSDQQQNLREQDASAKGYIMASVIYATYGQIENVPLISSVESKYWKGDSGQQFFNQNMRNAISRLGGSGARSLIAFLKGHETQIAA